MAPWLLLLTMTMSVSGCLKEAARPAPLTAAAAVAGGDDVQCRVERPTGSMLGTRVCTTKAQRDAIKTNTRTVQQDMGQAQTGGCHPAPC